MDGLLIRQLELQELDEAFQLIWKVFEKFVAPDYTQEGADTFYQEFIQGTEFHKKFEQGKEIMYGAYLEGELAGVLSISEKNHVSCVFVEEKFHRKGIGTKLFQKVIGELQQRSVTKIKLNASPYALPFYRYIGFKETGKEAAYKGIVYTPMELWIDKFSPANYTDEESEKS